MSTQHQIPPHLEAAKLEIEMIFKKYDIAGMAVLHGQNPDGTAYMANCIKLDPSYSVVEWNGKALYTKPLPSPLILEGETPKVQGHAPALVTINMLDNMRARIEQVWNLFGTAHMLVRAKFNVHPKSQGNGQQGG